MFSRATTILVVVFVVGFTSGDVTSGDGVEFIGHDVQTKPTLLDENFGTQSGNALDGKVPGLDVDQGNGLDEQTTIPPVQVTSPEQLKTGSEADGEDTASDNVGAPLILTELLEAGNITGARALAQVRGGPFPAHITSYSGFFTVDRRFDSNLFFWFFPAETNAESAPVMLWLQGGPGDSSLLGLFNEIGPFSVAADKESLIENPHSWHKNHSLIFIDNPVGAGFSFTNDTEGYATNLNQVTDSLYSAMMQFFKMFPEFQTNEFFIAGESYGGKYVPAFAHVIHKKNPSAELKINLKGIAVGNGFTDPICMLTVSDLVFQLGLIDTSAKEEMELLEEKAREAIRRGKFVYSGSLDGLATQVYSSEAEITNNYNFLKASMTANESIFVTFLDSAVVRALVHTGAGAYQSISTGHGGIQVHKRLFPVRMESAKPYVETLLEHYRVLYYSGQLDIICGYRMSVCMYQSLQWSAAAEYKDAKRHAWYVGDDLAGYMKSAGKFTEVLVRNAGHMVPLDQPAWALDLITQFTSNNFRHQQSKQ